MAYTEYSIIHSGADNISTLSGDIRLEENRGRLVVYDPMTKQERTIIDINGTKINDISGNTLTVMDTTGVKLKTSGGTTVSQLDNTGIHINNSSGSELTRIDNQGLTTLEPSGRRRVRIGIAPNDGRAGAWVSKAGRDVVSDLS